MPAADKNKKTPSGGGGLFIPNYNEKIRNAKAIVKKPKGKLARASKVRPFFLPPCNTGIVLTKLKKEKISKKKLARALVLPENYNLKDNYPIVVCGDRNDPSTSQYQQYACGCCWAYAIATAISDVYVVQNKYLTNPNLSWTYIMSCYPNESNPGNDELFKASALCGGGDVPSTVLWLKDHGLPSSMCVDYAWCLNDGNCTGSGTDTKDMNKGIPSCGCYNSGNFYRYKIKDVRRIALDEANDQSPESIMTVHSQIKNHLYVTGTMVGCFHVLENIVAVNPNSLKTGDFKTTKNPEGVYLECVGVEDDLKAEVPSDGNDMDACIYTYADGAATASDKKGEPLNLLGAHAVSMTGWGFAPVHRSLVRPDIERLYPSIKTYEADPSMVMVPYWWVRNSWGTSFAEGGFFKMAAYPFNRISCLERSIKITTSDGRSVIAGGCVLFVADQVVRDSFDANDQKGRAQAATASGGESGDKGSVETGHFEGANKNAALGKPIAYTQLSYSAADDVLPQVGTYQPPTTVGPNQPPTEEKKEIEFPEETTTPPPTSNFMRNLLYGVIGVLMIVILSLMVLYWMCKNTPEKCPEFVKPYFARLNQFLSPGSNAIYPTPSPYPQPTSTLPSPILSTVPPGLTIPPRIITTSTPYLR